MFKYLKQERWSPYLVGCLIALLSIASISLFHKTIGASTTFVKLAALFWAIFNPQHLHNTAYYQDYLNNKAWMDWQFMLVIGIFLGAYLASAFSSKKNKKVELPMHGLPQFIKSRYKRYLFAFIGGIIVMFGARFAGGCTSGHAISGGSQLALSGWLFMMGVFALGIPTALILYRKKN